MTTARRGKPTKSTAAKPAKQKRIRGGGKTRTRETRSPAGTRALARQLASSLTAGDLVLLVGELGAGKTEFVKGLAAGLGCRELVTSPTFTIIREYPATAPPTDGPVSQREQEVPMLRPPLFHLDLYRLGEDDIEELGVDEYRARGIVVAEWADRARSLWAAPYTLVTITSGATPAARTLTVRRVDR